MHHVGAFTVKRRTGSSAKIELKWIRGAFKLKQHLSFSLDDFELRCNQLPAQHGHPLTFDESTQRLQTSFDILCSQPLNWTTPQHALHGRTTRPHDILCPQLQPASSTADDDSAVNSRAGRDTMLSSDARLGSRAGLETPGGFLLR